MAKVCFPVTSFLKSYIKCRTCMDSSQEWINSLHQFLKWVLDPRKIDDERNPRVCKICKWTRMPPNSGVKGSSICRHQAGVGCSNPGERLGRREGWAHWKSLSLKLGAQYGSSQLCVSVLSPTSRQLSTSAFYCSDQGNNMNRELVNFEMFDKCLLII